METMLVAVLLLLTIAVFGYLAYDVATTKLPVQNHPAASTATAH